MVQEMGARHIPNDKILNNGCVDFPTNQNYKPVVSDSGSAVVEERQYVLSEIIPMSHKPHSDNVAHRGWPDVG